MKWIAIIVVLFTSLAASKQTHPTTRPTTQITMEGCVTSECHANIKTSPVIHGPIAVNACDACHETVDPQKHTFKAARDGADICTYCHEFDISQEPVIHKPVKTGECLGCHDPHGGRDATLTREASMAEMCGRCHEPITRDKHFLHSPVNQGACDSCHTPHASRFSKLLDRRGADLCMTCHANFESKLVRVRTIHKALDQGCQKCHDAHGSSSPAATTQPVKQLCVNCHETIATRAEAATSKHTPVMGDDRACMNCHTPHGGDHDGLMSDVPSRVCLKCHNQSIKTSSGRLIASLNEVENPELVRHGSIRDGQCGGCHEPHGGTEPSLLTRYVSRAFYQPFAEDKYALCLSCHDQRMVRDERISGVTSFRDGDRNLHYVHVSVGKRSHSCFVCHETHVGPNPRLLRDRTPFGVWQLPMNFRMNATGGTCAPGCHVPYGYDRVQAIGPTTLPSGGPTLPTVRREHDDAATTMRFAAVDVEGREVIVPGDVTIPTLIVFCGTDQVMRELSQPMPGIRLVIICGGADAAQLGHRIADNIAGATTVVDSNNELAAEFSVRGWPTAFVVSKDGAILSRLSGSLQLLPMKLRPYLAEEQPQIVGGDSRTVASRSLQIALKLLDDGKPADARDILTQALQLDPKSTVMRVTMIKCLIELKESKEAMARLRDIAEPDLKPGEREVLASQIYASVGKWDQARQYATRAIGLNATSPEAHIQLGRVLEHEGNLKEALGEYRTGNALLKRTEPSRP